MDLARGNWRQLMSVAPLVAVVAFAAGCDGESSEGAGKYDQSWAKSYSATTCSEWFGEMTDGQRWAAAADMLTAARVKGDGGDGMPSDSLVDDFRDDVGDACSAEGQVSVAEVGAMVYLVGRSTFAP